MPLSSTPLQHLLQHGRYDEVFDLLLPEISTKATTKANTLSGWRNYVRWLEETGESLLNFKHPEVEYLAWLKAQDAAPSTLNNRLLQVRKLYDLLLERELIDRNPFEGKQMEYNPVHERRQVYSWEEVDRLLAHADTEERLMVLLGADAGLSGGEVRFLKFSDVIGNGHVLQVWRVRYREKSDFQPVQLVQTSPALRAALMQWVQKRGEAPLYGMTPEGYLFQEDGRAWTNPELLSKLYHLCLRANVEYKPWRALRHVAGVRKLTAGVDRQEIQRQLGVQRLDPLIRKTGAEDGRKLRWKRGRGE